MTGNRVTAQASPFSQEQPKRITSEAFRNVFDGALFDRMINIVSDIKMERLRNIFLSAQSGYPAELYDVYTAIEASDPRIKGLVATRVNASARAAYTVTPGIKDNPESERIAQLVRMNLEAIGIHNIRPRLMDGRKYGVSLFELVWANVDGNILLKRMDYIDSSRIEFDMSIVPNSENWGAIRIRRDWVGDLMYIKDAPPYKILPAIDTDRKGYFDIQGFMRPVARYYILKTFAMQSWASYAEVYGFPTVIAKIPEVMFKANKNLVKAMLENVGPNRYGVFFKEMEAEVHQTASTSTVDIFERLINLANVEMAIAILGQNLTSEVSGGSYAASQTHLEVLANLILDDLTWQDELINKYIVDAITVLNAPDLPYEAWPKFVSSFEQKRDLVSISAGLKGMAGLIPIPTDYLYHVSGIPKPSPKDETIGGFGNSLVDILNNTI